MLTRNPMTETAKAVFAARVERGWSQRDLARIAGLSRGFIVKLEDGRVEPNVDQLTKIVTAVQEAQAA